MRPTAEQIEDDLCPEEDFMEEGEGEFRDEPPDEWCQDIFVSG